MLLSAPNTPIYYLSKKQLFRQRKWRKRANPIYLQTCKFFGATLIDRTETLETGIPFQVLDSIRHLSQTGVSFASICQQRAAEIAHTTSNRPIRVLWSGGIDSTVALIALIKELRAQDQLHRLKVLLSQESIQEFPSFFHEEIEHKLPFDLITTTIYDHIRDDEVSVTGEHGDQLFGSDKLKYAVQTGEAYRPYEDVLPYFISRKLGTEKHTQAIIDYIQPQLAHSPVTLSTYYDYLWWMNFSLKWQNVSLRLIDGLGKAPDVLGKTFFHFFRSLEFQNWSISNHDKKIKQEWNSYKYIAKQYIHDFHPDEEYLAFKEKEPSLKEVLVRKHTRGFFSA